MCLHSGGEDIPRKVVLTATLVARALAQIAVQYRLGIATFSMRWIVVTLIALARAFAPLAGLSILLTVASALLRSI